MCTEEVKNASALVRIQLIRPPLLEAAGMGRCRLLLNGTLAFPARRLQAPASLLLHAFLLCYFLDVLVRFRTGLKAVHVVGIANPKNC